MAEKGGKTFRPEVTNAVRVLLEEAKKDQLGIALWLEDSESETLAIGLDEDKLENASIGLLALMAIIYDMNGDRNRSRNADGITQIINTVMRHTKNPVTLLMAKKITTMIEEGAKEGNPNASNLLDAMKEMNKSLLDDLLGGD